ncbi:hypothetical protein Bpfe_012394, partial [Biomphalaria pfeifferi]
MSKECGKLTLNDVAPANRARCPRQMRDTYTKKSEDNTQEDLKDMLLCNGYVENVKRNKKLFQ